MNKDQIKGVAKQAGGKIEEEAGKLTGNKNTQIKGALKQAAGKSEKKLGDAKEIIKSAVKKSQ